MRILLDENLDRRLKDEFDEEHVVETVHENGWSGTTNGKLLALAEEHFDVFVTADRNLGAQQNLANFDLAVFVLVARSNRLADHVPLIPLLIKQLRDAESGVLTEISSA